MRADCKEQRSSGPHIGFMSIIVCPPAPVCKQCNAITIYNANTKQWQQQMQSQFTTQIKTMTTTNAIKSRNTNTKQLQYHL